MNKKMIKTTLLAIAFIVSIPLGLAAQDEGYYPYSFARLSYVNGSVYIERTSNLGYEKGEVNLALVQGDKMGTESGQAEIHFGKRNYLRLGDNTKVEFAILPSEGDERINIHLTDGSAYFRVSALATDKGIEIHTPDASFYVLEEGLYRFDVTPEGQTRVFVREGSLEAATEEGSVLVRAQETVTAADGRLLGQPEYGNSRNDAFDEWNGSRDTQLSARSDRQYLPTDIGEYEEELDQNGHWVYERPYGNVWVPNVSDYDDWQPYYYGRWSWYPLIGWTWISSEPWGWPVYHYGRWNWRFGLGWYWIPQSHWGPAWVSWWSDRDYVGWCPLTWYNRPGYLYNNRFYDRWDDRYFSAHNRAMTVVRRDHLQSHDVGRRRVGSADLDRIGRVELRGQQPSIRPAVDRGGPQAIAARRALDRPGSRNQVKGLAPSRSVSSSSLRRGGTDAGIRSRDRGTSQPEGNRNAVVRPSIRNDGAGSRSIRSYPSQRTSGGRDQSGIIENRRGGVASPGRGAGSRSNDARVTRSQGQDPGSSRTSTVKTYPSTTRQGSTDKGNGTTSTARSIRSGSERSSNSSSGRSQSRTYSSRSSVSRPSSRLSAPSISSSRPSSAVSRPSSSGRSGSPSYSRSPSSSSRTPSYSQPRSSYSSPSRSSSSSSRARSSYSSPSRSSSPSMRSYSAPRSSGSTSGRSFSAPRSSGFSSGRSYSAPRSSGSSSGRSYSSPRSGGSSSGRSSGSVRSGGSSSSGGGRSSSSGRSGSSSSKSSGSSSRSGSARRK